MRTTQDVRERLERAAADSGRSLVQEVEHRLERSFLDQEAREREMGGRETYNVLRLLGVAAMIVEERTGKKWIEDWKTAVAVRKTWHLLVGRNMPKLPRDADAILQEEHSIPALPVRPPLPWTPSGLLASALPAADPDEMAAYESALNQYDKAMKQYDKAVEKREQKRLRQDQVLQDYIREPRDLGREVADLFPRKQSKD